MAFTLQYLTTTKTLAEWGADDSAVLAFQNQSEGSLKLRFPDLATADVPFPFKGKVILRQDDTVIFRGHALAPERAASGAEEGITVEFVDAWWFLSNGTITQTIYDGANTPASRAGVVTFGTYNILTDTTGLSVGMKLTCPEALSGVAQITAIGTGSITVDKVGLVSAEHMLIFQGGETASNLVALFAQLNLGIGWDKRTINDTLSAIITACDVHHGGGVIQFGACHGPAFTIQPQPVDITGTFADAVRAALVFAPDAVPQFDYTTDPPTLSFYQRGAAAVQTAAFADERVMISQDIQSRPDLQIDGVRILYQYYLADGSPASAVDEAGETSGPGVVQVQFNLYPPSQQPTQVPAVVEKQYLRSEAVDVTDRNWWFKNADVPVADASDIAVEVVSGTTPKFELDPDAPENDGYTSLDGCTKRLLEGNIPGWLNASAHLRYARAIGKLSFIQWADPDHTTYPTDPHTILKRTVTLTFPVTDLGTNDYENVISEAHTEGGTFDPESPPSGIAAAILAAQSVLQFQGSITLTDEECDFAWMVGQALNISGGRSEWAAMKAQIQGVTHQLHSGTTVITFGPAEHLAPQDYLEITRRMMRLKPALALDTRASGPTEASGSGEVHHPTTAVRLGKKQSDSVQGQRLVVSSGSIETTVASGKTVWSDGTTTVTVDASGKLFSIAGGGKSAVIDLDHLPAGAVAQFRSITVCDGGVQKTAYVLMTVPA